MTIGKSRIFDRFECCRIVFRTCRLQKDPPRRCRRQRIIADPAGRHPHPGAFRAGLNRSGQRGIRFLQFKADLRQQPARGVQHPAVGSGAVHRQLQSIRFPRFPAQLGIVPHGRLRQFVLCVIFPVLDHQQFHEAGRLFGNWTLRQLEIPAVPPVRRTDPEAAEFVRIGRTGFRRHRDNRPGRHRLSRCGFLQRHILSAAQRAGKRRRRRLCTDCVFPHALCRRLRRKRRQRIIADRAGSNLHPGTFRTGLNRSGQCGIRFLQLETNLRQHVARAVQHPAVGSGTIHRQLQDILFSALPAQLGIFPHGHFRQFILRVVFPVSDHQQLHKARRLFGGGTLCKLKIPAVLPIRRTDPEPAKLVRIGRTGLRRHRDNRPGRHRFPGRVALQRHIFFTA